MVKVKGVIFRRVSERLCVICVEFFYVEQSFVKVLGGVNELRYFLVLTDFVLTKNFFDEKLQLDLIRVHVGKNSDKTVNDCF